jgi:hypothetical protein
LRSSHLALALLALSASCGTGGDPAATGGDVASVLVATGGAFVGSTVVDSQGSLVVTSGEALQVVAFAPGSVIPSTWSAPDTQPEIELALAGDTLWWAANDGKESVLWSLPVGSFVQSPKATAFFPGSYAGDVVGLVADTSAVYAAVSTPQPATLGLQIPSPDSPAWPGSPAVDTVFAGDVYRVGTNPPSPPVRHGGALGGATFLPGFMQHLLVQSSTEVYWADSTSVGGEAGRVMAASKAAWATDPGRRVGGISAIGTDIGFVGLAATDTTVAWAAAATPYPGSTGCWVWVAPVGSGAARMIFDSTQATSSFLCNGLALDAQYVYFAMVEVHVPPAGANSSLLLGTAIVRVPLSAQGSPQVVPLQSDRWYGPRRVLVDDTYVYAIDPSYVMRLPKSAFGP